MLELCLEILSAFGWLTMPRGPAPKFVRLRHERAKPHYDLGKGSQPFDQPTAQPVCSAPLHFAIHNGLCDRGLLKSLERLRGEYFREGRRNDCLRGNANEVIYTRLGDDEVTFYERSANLNITTLVPSNLAQSLFSEAFTTQIQRINILEVLGKTGTTEEKHCEIWKAKGIRLHSSEDSTKTSDQAETQ